MARTTGVAPRPRRYDAPSYPRALGIGMALLAVAGCGGAVEGSHEQSTGTGGTQAQTGGGGGSKHTGGTGGVSNPPEYFGGGSGGGGAPEPYTGGFGGMAGAAGQAGEAGQAGQAGAPPVEDAGSADAELVD